MEPKDMIPFKQTILAAGVLALSAGAASALPAVTANDLNLRAGPGTGYGVVAVMPAGAAVDAYDCGGGWCRVDYGGQIGFASRRYLDIGYASYDRSGYGAYAYAPGPLGFPLWPWNW
jgi:uncharacterized protein YraI